MQPPSYKCMCKLIVYTVDVYIEQNMFLKYRSWASPLRNLTTVVQCWSLTSQQSISQVGTASAIATHKARHQVLQAKTGKTAGRTCCSGKMGCTFWCIVYHIQYLINMIIYYLCNYSIFIYLRDVTSTTHKTIKPFQTLHGVEVFPVHLGRLKTFLKTVSSRKPDKATSFWTWSVATFIFFSRSFWA